MSLYEMTFRLKRLEWEQLADGVFIAYCESPLECMLVCKQKKPWKNEAWVARCRGKEIGRGLRGHVRPRVRNRRLGAPAGERRQVATCESGMDGMKGQWKV